MASCCECWVITAHNRVSPPAPSRTSSESIPSDSARGRIPLRSTHPSPCPEPPVTGHVLSAPTTLARLQSLLICAVCAAPPAEATLLCLQYVLSNWFKSVPNAHCIQWSLHRQRRPQRRGNITALRLSSLLTFASMLAAGESKAAAAATGAIMANFLPRSATAAMVAERAHHIRVDSDFVTCTQ